ncbi:T9SS type A sorting domain-containing protein [Emticicia sp. C21]|uniref:T9SS type A sorting domain-containing protein n=1 Tax=Emticicia sp. C21 TaxID=2302915 RepID=UPI000E344D80|nr:T9SS type A sorting domain-containing protein [Emticicia sp. C21]RFS13959.1 T9SS C-terminal target domain-containing protein [Emticicia sp. C21]
MKKVLLLVLISLNTFSQVFYLDTTFVSEPLLKPFGVQEPLVNQFPNGLLYLKSSEKILNGGLEESGTFLLNTEAKILKYLTNEALTDYDYRYENSVITPDNKILLTRLIGPSSYSLIKISQEGVIDTTFKFSNHKRYISKIALLKNENFVLFFFSQDSYLLHEMYDKNGKFIRSLAPSMFTNATGAQLTDIISNDLNEYFLLLIDSKRNAEIIKTNADFEIDKNFSPVKFSGIEAYTHKLERVGNDFLVYQTGVEGLRDKVEKIDRNGTRIWNISFDKISAYEERVNFFEQSDGSIDMIYYDNKHLKINAKGIIDSTLYDREFHKNTSFLHAFADGSYWIMRDKSGIIEKMNADGSIDKDLRVIIQVQKQLFPDQILKLPTNTYLVDFISHTHDNSPYSIRYSPYPKAVQVYDNKHKLLHEFFDSKTIWKTYKTTHSFVVRGDGKFYTIDEANKMTVSKDTLEANDVIDWDNNFVYRLIKKDSLIRYKIGQGLDKTFLIKAQQISNFIIMEDKRIAIETYENGIPARSYINMYHINGTLDRAFKTIVLDYSFYQFTGGLPITIKNANGLIVNQMAAGEYANIVKQQFLKYDSNGNPDKDYQSNIYRGGYFRQYEKDGSIFMNTSNEVKEHGEEIIHNFLKITPKGRIDSSFTLLGADAIYGFEFFDENTLYAAGQNSLLRFIKQPLKKDEYFHYKALPSQMTWDIALPRKLIINTNIKDIKVEVSGNGSFKNEFISFEPKAGITSITIKDNNNRILAKQKIELTRIYPQLIYDESQFSKAQEPFEFKVQSSSGLPVKISIDGGNEHTGSIILDPKRDKGRKLKLRSEQTEKYETLEIEITLDKLIPLATESENIGVRSYPNPVTDKLIVEKNGFIIDTFKLISTDGKANTFELTEYTDKYELVLRNVSSGLYFLVLRAKDRQFVRRIWKE